MDFMQLNDQERVICASDMWRKDARHRYTTIKLSGNVNVMTWVEFVGEFNQRYFSPATLRAQQNKFINLKKGNTTMIEAVREFEQLFQLCPFMVNTKEEGLR